MITFSLDIMAIGKAVLALAAVILVVLFLRGVYRGLRRLLLSPKMHGLDRKGISFRWSEIERLLNEKGEMGPKMAILEADKLLDYALKAMSMPGMTLGERLKFAAYKYPKIRKVWWAHKLRNQLVHESTFYIDTRTARRAIKTYKATLRMLNIL